MPIKVRMIPHLDDLSGESGINTVIRKWFDYLHKFDIELVGKDQDSFDLLAVHAGMTDRQIEGVPTISHLHGMYWSADYSAQTWEWAANAQIVKTIRQSKVLTVPSSWVAETFQRDMRVNPFIVPHGVDLKEWKKPSAKGKYVIGYLKNRSYVDVCNPQFLTDLASRFPNIEFISTFPVPGNPSNVRITGVMSHDKIADLMRDALAIISPIKETFGILTLEAMASGIPVLGYDYGGNKDLVRHGETGYLARVNDGNDLAEGLAYCIEHRSVLGSNARNAASLYTWDAVCKNLAGIYRNVIDEEKEYKSIPKYIDIKLYADDGAV